MTLQDGHIRDVREGWAWPTDSARRQCYMVAQEGQTAGFSLCGKYGFFWSTVWQHNNEATHDALCTNCKKKLAKRRLQTEKAVKL